MDGHLKLLVFDAHLGLDNGDDALHNLPQGDRVHAESHLAAFDLRHIQHVVDEPQQVLGGQGDLLQAVLHLVLVVDIGRGNGGHAYDGVHGSAYVVGHVREKFALGLGGGVGVPPSGLQSLHLLTGQTEINSEDGQKRQQDCRRAQQSGDRPLPVQGVDNGVHSAVGHKGDQVPLGIGQTGTVEMPPLSFYGKRAGVVFVVGHGGGKLLEVFRRALASHVVIDGQHPVKVIVPGSVPCPHHKRTVTADDVGVFMVAGVVQGEGLGDVVHRQRAHQSHTGMR